MLSTENRLSSNPLSSPLRIHRKWRVLRRGAATLDYVLTMGIVLPMSAVVLWFGPRIIRLVYELTRVMLSWPF